MEVDVENVRKWAVVIYRNIFYLLLIQGFQKFIYLIPKLLDGQRRQHLSREVGKNKRFLTLFCVTTTILMFYKQLTIGEDFLAIFVAHLVVQLVGTQVTINYGVGMACSFFEGYLTHIIPSDGANFVGFQENIRTYESSQGVKFPVHKLFIVITRSLYCPTNLSCFNKQNRPDLAQLECCQSLEDVVKDVAGVKQRVYRNTAYKITRPDHLPPVYLAAEFATPLHTLHCVLDKRYIYDELCDVDVQELVEDFCGQLQKTIDRSPNCRGKCTLVYYDDQDATLNLADILLDKIREDEPNFEDIIRRPRNSYQGGCLSVLTGGGSIHALSLWETRIVDGYITKFLDPELKTMVIEIGGTNVSTTYMKCPPGRKELGITMPFLIMVVKNLHKYFTFEVTIRDGTGFKRRFRVANFQSHTQILPSCTAMPIGLKDGWNQVQFNLSDFTQRAYKKSFFEVVSLKINANIRIKRIYFSNKLYTDEELPKEYRLFYPITSESRPKKAVEVKSRERLVNEIKEPERIPSAEIMTHKAASGTTVPLEPTAKPTPVASETKMSVDFTEKKSATTVDVIDLGQTEEVEQSPEGQMNEGEVTVGQTIETDGPVEETIQSVQETVQPEQAVEVVEMTTKTSTDVETALVPEMVPEKAASSEAVNEAGTTDQAAETQTAEQE